MADPVLEARIQQFKDLEREAVRGCTASATTLFFALNEIAAQQTKWQWIIHGDTITYRKRCVRWLVQEKRFTQARRFALCGRGDVGSLGDDGSGVRIQPRGCGARFCPRCSKRYGRRYLNRVNAHLSRGPHGQMWHMVLTQRVLPEERLLGARERFNKAWNKFYTTLRRVGMHAALATYHVTPSGLKGWHFHCHVLVEFKAGLDANDFYHQLDEAWFAALRDGDSQRKPLFMRLVTEAGDVMLGLKDDTQLEFWSESTDQVEKVLQYVLRDVLQGVEGWIARLQTDEQAKDFAAALSKAKLHRLYGTWRKALPDQLDVDVGDTILGCETVDEKGQPKKGVTLWTPLGSMDELFWMARKGDTQACEFVRRLLSRSNNKGVVGIRLARLVRDVAA